MTQQGTELAVLGLTPTQYASLSDAAAANISGLADRVHQRQTSYAKLGMICGTAGFLACIGAFVYLVVEHHSTESYVVLGTAVLALLRSIFKSRL